MFKVRKEIFYGLKLLRFSFLVFLFLVFLLGFVFIILFYFINFFLSLKSITKNKINSFESGFVRVGFIQNSFSIHFFVIIVMFVIFDLEIVMFLGVLLVDFFSFFSVFFLLLFIILGFYIEWFLGKLVWVI